MEPALKEGRLVFGVGWFRSLKPGNVVIFEHKNIEKIKRIQKITDGKIFVVGDNQKNSTDSRQFGWIDKDLVLAKIF